MGVNLFFRMKAICGCVIPNGKLGDVGLHRGALTALQPLSCGLCQMEVGGGDHTTFWKDGLLPGVPIKMHQQVVFPHVGVCPVLVPCLTSARSTISPI